MLLIVVVVSAGVAGLRNGSDEQVAPATDPVPTPSTTAPSTTAAGPTTTTPPTWLTARGRVTTTGSSVVEPIVLGVGEVLRRSNDELEVTAEGPGGEDSDLLCAGAVDLATTSRPIRPTSASAATRPASRWPS